MTDPRIYVFVHFSSSGSYGFIALRDSTVNATDGVELIPLETWNDKYVICRVAYTKQKAAEKTASYGMMDGPDLYSVFDSTTTVNSQALITVWKPRLIEGIEFAIGQSEHKTTSALAFDEIKKHCVEALDIQITKCDVVHEHDVLREFIL